MPGWEEMDLPERKSGTGRKVVGGLLVVLGVAFLFAGGTMVAVIAGLWGTTTETVVGLVVVALVGGGAIAGGIVLVRGSRKMWRREIPFDELQKLGRLRSSGALSEDEYWSAIRKMSSH